MPYACFPHGPFATGPPASPSRADVPLVRDAFLRRIRYIFNDLSLKTISLMATTLGINGFGRIGRLVLRSIVERGDTDFEIVGINDLTPAATLAHLLKYDSVHGTLDADVSNTDDSITVGDLTVPVFNEKDPANLPWDEVGCDIVIHQLRVDLVRGLERCVHQVLADGLHLCHGSGVFAGIDSVAVAQAMR